MPVIGGVVVVDDRFEIPRSDQRFSWGPPTGARLPFVLETSLPGEDRDLLLALRDAPGVAFVEIAFVDFSDAQHSADRVEAP